MLGPLFYCANTSSAVIYASRGEGVVLEVKGLSLPIPTNGLLVGLDTEAASRATTWTAALVFPNTAAADGVYALQCDISKSVCLARFINASFPFPYLSSACAYASASPSRGVTVWVTGMGGTAAWEIDATSPWSQPVTLLTLLSWGATAIAHSVLLHEITLGNSTKVASFDDFKPVAIRTWEWVTDIATGAGGPYDDTVTSLAYTVDGTLYVGNPTCLNVRSPTGAISRVARDQGLPWGNITALAVDDNSARLWIGTTRGVILYDPLAPFKGVHQKIEVGGHTAISLSRWRYFYGPRYLITTSTFDFFAASATTALAIDGNTTHVASALGGLSILQTQSWTLSEKAAVYEAAISRHSRLGLLTQCNLPSFGVTTSCINTPDDNNGLWTSLTVAALAFRYAATGNASALAATIEHFQAMRLLAHAPGIPGLIARSVVGPGSGAQGDNWHNSTAPGFEGWQWKGDASSDEVVGHFFAYIIIAATVPTLQAEANAAIVELVSYIVLNNFTLIDITGLPTTWGHWDPATLNYARDDWSDTRGLNSLQMLAMLVSGLAATTPGSENHILFTNAWHAIAPSEGGGAGYASNTLNQKILAPSDDNYSDDELAMLSYAALFQSLKLLNSSDPAIVTAPERVALFASLERTHQLLRGLRSSLWNAIIAAALNDIVPGDADDTVWNLRTWPISLIDWPVMNSHRLDIVLDSNWERNGWTTPDSVTILPANERAQTRWNGNPHDLDGGSGTDESDPGAFLLMYWYSRAAGILAS